MIYELRQYTIFEGKMDEWIDLMESEIIPFQTSKGMDITGSFRSLEDPQTYIWMRKFESDDQRKQLYAAVYESEQWKDMIGPKVGELLDRDSILVQTIEPTASFA